MADGELILKVDEGLADRLRQAADAAGQPVELYVRQALEAYAEGEWPRAALASLAEYQRTGEYIGVEEAMDAFERKVEERLAARK